MSYSLLVKGVSGLAVAGTVTTGALYFGTDLFKKEEEKKEAISSLIRKANPEKRLITATEGTDSHGQAAWKLYREKNQNSEKDVWSVDGGKKSDTTVQLENAPEAFIRACSSKSSIQVLNKEDALYNQVLTYCTRDTLVSDLVSETEGKTSLVGSTNTEDGNGAGKVYQGSNKDKPKDQDVGKLKDWDTQNAKPDAPQTFKDECKKRADTKTGSKEHSDYKNFLLGCVKQ